MTQPNPDIIAMAKALAKADGKDPDAPAWVEGYGNRERTFGICWRDQYLDKATAAYSTIQPQLEKMREALREALDMVVDACRDGGYSVSEHRALAALLTPLEQRED